jgi:hypothetical protein
VSPAYAASAQRFSSSFATVGATTLPRKTASSWLTSRLFAPVTTMDNGVPRSSTSRWRLLPFFPPIRGVCTGTLTRQGGFVHTAVYGLPSPRNAFHVIVFGKAAFPKFLKKSQALPFPEIAMYCARAPKDLLRQGFPLYPGA